jgi:hypothetical protein
MRITTGPGDIKRRDGDFVANVRTRQEDLKVRSAARTRIVRLDTQCSGRAGLRARGVLGRARRAQGLPVMVARGAVCSGLAGSAYANSRAAQAHATTPGQPPTGRSFPCRPGESGLRSRGVLERERRIARARRVRAHAPKHHSGGRHHYRRIGMRNEKSLANQALRTAGADGRLTARSNPAGPGDYH